LRREPRREASAHRPSRRTIVLGAAALGAIVAAAVLVVVLTRHHATSGRSSDASTPPVARGAYAGDVGDVTQPTALRAVLERRSVRAAVLSHATTARVDGAGASALHCAATLEGPAARHGDRVVLLATATYGGRPAFVVGMHHGARTIVFVVDRRDCSVLVSQSQ
jgi:hypothetical protein